MIKAVIYDVDGTMIDSEPLHVEAWNKSLHHYHRKLADLSDDFRSTMAGKKPIAIAEGMIEELHLTSTPAELLEKKAEIFMDSVKTDLKEMPGAVESIKRLGNDGFLLGVGTSLDRSYIIQVLSRLGVEREFDVIVTGDEIRNGKPHPETYQTVAEKLGVKTENCVVLEDAQSGIQSAKAAGCLCVAIRSPHAIPQNTDQADITVPSLHFITANFLKNLDNVNASGASASSG